MSPPTRKAPILTAAGFAALLVLAAAFLWLRDGAREPSARPSAKQVATEEAASSLASANASGDERESLPLAAEAPAETASSTVSEDESAPRVVVVVRDIDSAPVPGALVEIIAQGPPGKWTCDAVGRCKLPIEPWTGSVELRVSAEGFVTNCIRGGRSEEFLVLLLRSVVVRGRVVAADDGSPRASARVSVAFEECDEPAPEVVADAAGKFELSGLPLRQGLRWSAAADGFATLEREIELRDPELEVVLELKRGLPLEISVVDAQTGAAIEGARIVREPVEVLTDARGLATTTALLSLDEDEVLLATFTPKYCSLWTVIRPSAVDPKVPLRFPLLLGARLEGNVVDPNGSPLADVEVRLNVDFGGQRADPNRLAGFREVNLPEGWRLQGSRGESVATDANGRFAFEGLEPLSPWYRASLSRDGVGLMDRREVPTLGAAGATTQVQFVADPAAACAIAGTMTLNGAPARGYVNWRGPTRAGGALADLNGHYRLEGVEPGHVVLKPQPDGSGGPRNCDPFPGPWTVEARAGSEARLDFPLELEMAVIAGRVVDATGAPKADVGVLVMSREGCWRGYAPTKEDGSFEFTVRAGAWSYFVQAGQAPDQVRQDDVLAGTRDLELALPGSGMLRLRVVDARTRSILRDFVVRLEGSSGESRVLDTRTNGDITPDAQGWHELYLKPGTWRLFVSDPDDERTRYLPIDGGTVALHAGKEPQSLELERERGLELDLRLAEGQQPWPKETFVLLLEPATADQVVLDKRGWNIGQAYRGISVIAARSVQLDPSGHARISALRPGPHRFVAFPDTIAVQPSEVSVTGTESGPIEIRWTPR
jgi:hypothetical protein